MDERGRKSDFRFAETAFMSEASGNPLEGAQGTEVFRNGRTFPGPPPEVECSVRTESQMLSISGASRSGGATMSTLIRSIASLIALL